MRKYGADAFAFRIVSEFQTMPEALDHETKLIVKRGTLLADRAGYNIWRTGPHDNDRKAGAMSRYLHIIGARSEEFRAKMRGVAKGRDMTAAVEASTKPENIQKRSATRKANTLARGGRKRPPASGLSRAEGTALRDERHREAYRAHGIAMGNDPENQRKSAEAVRRLHAAPAYRKDHIARLKRTMATDGWKQAHQDGINRKEVDPRNQLRRRIGIWRHHISTCSARNPEELGAKLKEAENELRRLDGLA